MAQSPSAAAMQPGGLRLGYHGNAASGVFSVVRIDELTVSHQIYPPGILGWQPQHRVLKARRANGGLFFAAASPCEKM